jgi:hypothetical protein
MLGMFKLRNTSEAGLFQSSDVKKEGSGSYSAGPVTQDTVLFMAVKEVFSNHADVKYRRCKQRAGQYIIKE